VKAALLTIVIGVFYMALRIRWQLRHGQRSGPPADFLPNGWSARNPGYYSGCDNGCDND
jgi:hypothetical protein